MKDQMIDFLLENGYAVLGCIHICQSYKKKYTILRSLLIRMVFVKFRFMKKNFAVGDRILDCSLKLIGGRKNAVSATSPSELCLYYTTRMYCKRLKMFYRFVAWRFQWRKKSPKIKSRPRRPFILGILAHPVGFEPTTNGIGIRYSIRAELRMDNITRHVRDNMDNVKYITNTSSCQVGLWRLAQKM